MTSGQKKAIKRICEEYDFENLKELRQHMRDCYDDPFDLDCWDETEDALYKEITTLFSI